MTHLLVVTPTLGQSRWLDATIASVDALRVPRTHLLVAPASMTAGLARRFPQCKVVPEPSPGRGMYAAMNAGVAAVENWNVLTCLNDDDRLSSPGFDVAAGAGAEIAYGRVAFIDSQGARLGAIPVARHGGDLAALLARGIMPLAQPGTMFHRDVWKKLGGFDESYRLAGDLDFFVRALAAGLRFTYVGEQVAEFRLSEGQLSKRRAEMLAETARALTPLTASPRPVAALWRFRLGNLGVYADRVRRHGFVSMQKMYERT
jgi:hypothetical protein